MPNTIDHIRNSLSEVGAPSSDYDLNPEITLPEERKLRPAAVLIPLIRKNDAWHVILTMRSDFIGECDRFGPGIAVCFALGAQRRHRYSGGSLRRPDRDQR